MTNIPSHFVVATAGHVDHGKSALVRALTGTEPDRWEEERARGLTIDLGFAETVLASGKTVSFVDVPGHERFIANMLAGIGAAPVVCLVVAADDGWSRQTSEHRDAIQALGVKHGVIAVTKSDLVDKSRIREVQEQIREELADTGLAQADIIAVSALEKLGLDHLLAALEKELAAMPVPDGDEPLRVWVDRSFSISGAGTIITGTLNAGTVQIEDKLLIDGETGQHPVTIRGLQSHGTQHQKLHPTTRAAINLRGIDHHQISRGDALVTPNRWWSTDTVDVIAQPGMNFAAMPAEFTVHIGTASLTAHCRVLDEATARLRLSRQLPLHVGDKLIIRGTGKRLVLGGAIIMDVEPLEFTRRGQAAKRANQLRGMTPENQLELFVQAHQTVEVSRTRSQGIPWPQPHPPSITQVGAWLIATPLWEQWGTQLIEQLQSYHQQNPMSPGMPAAAVQDKLRVPAPEVLEQLVLAAPVISEQGTLRYLDFKPSLGKAENAIAQLIASLKNEPFEAPEAEDLDQLGLGDRELAAAHRQKKILRLEDNIILLPQSPALAMRELAKLPQPFSVSQARQALGTTRRIAIPLLEHLDARGWTVREGNQRRVK